MDKRNKFQQQNTNNILILLDHNHPPCQINKTSATGTKT